MNATSKKNQKNLFLIPLTFRGKPFLGLAQLSKIFYVFYYGQNNSFSRKFMELKGHFNTKDKGLL